MDQTQTAIIPYTPPTPEIQNALIPYNSLEGIMTVAGSSDNNWGNYGDTWRDSGID